MTRTIAHKRLVVGEKKQRFGFRKTILGLCGAILGSTLLMVNAANNANTVHAAESDKSVQRDDSAHKEVAQTKVDAANDSSLNQDETAGAGKVTDKGAQGVKSADVDVKYVRKQNQVTTQSKDTQGVTKADSANATS
ncbi:putative cross-wall-targeting lipoprotein signal domain-containing proteiin, partial [Lactobacillus helveticus]|uniref:putative cross-wall-targeting lipoprotein signal domain-containing proteiin n=1 Tax=Lactobacillus helveticus TaxID=1587 RepID=UPI001564965E